LKCHFHKPLIKSNENLFVNLSSSFRVSDVTAQQGTFFVGATASADLQARVDELAMGMRPQPVPTPCLVLNSSASSLSHFPL
jgi:hypothetical protein